MRRSQIFWCGWEALPNVWEWLGGPSGCPGVVGRPSRMPGSCREALSHPVVVGRPSQMSCCGQEALPDVQVTPGCLGVVERPSQIYGSDWEALPNIREW